MSGLHPPARASRVVSMASASRPLRRDAATWTAAAAMAAASLALALTLRPARPDALPPPDAPPAPARAGPPASSAPRPPPVEASRAEAFHARLSVYLAQESRMRRAFLPPQAVSARPLRPVNVHLVKVTPGATPQACLAQAVYYEARGEPREGQAAVAQVVLNRARSGSHPASVCGVVFEGASRPGCQFSFACDGRLGGRRPAAAAWRQAETVAAEALDGRRVAGVEGALNYHADYVRPRWAAQLRRTAEIGRHIFYAALSPFAHAAAAWSPPPPAEPAAGATD